MCSNKLIINVVLMSGSSSCLQNHFQVTVVLDADSLADRTLRRRKNFILAEGPGWMKVTSGHSRGTVCSC